MFLTKVHPENRPISDGILLYSSNRTILGCGLKCETCKTADDTSPDVFPENQMSHCLQLEIFILQKLHRFTSQLLDFNIAFLYVLLLPCLTDKLEIVL